MTSDYSTQLYDIDDFEFAVRKGVINSFLIKSEKKVVVVLSGDEGRAPYYASSSYSISLSFIPHAKPKSYPVFPLLRFESIVYHCMISPTGTMAPAANYEMKIFWKTRSDNRLFSFLVDLKTFLSEPWIIRYTDDLIDLLVPADQACNCCGGHVETASNRDAKDRTHFYEHFRRIQREMAETEFQKFGEINLERSKKINAYREFGPKMPSFFEPNPIIPDSFFDPRFLSCDSITDIMEEDCPGVFSFPLFAPSFCEYLMQEIARYRESGLPISRPNSMNNYGLILDDIGMEGFFDHLIQSRLCSIAEDLFPTVSQGLDSHHAFVVEYATEGDQNLDMHIDDSEVTFNINLHDQFSGSSLIFCGLFNTPKHRKHSRTYVHQLGRCVIHRGDHRHGAAPISSGSRTNLIIWCRSSSLRLNTSRVPDPAAESGPPDLICLSHTHDADYRQYS